MDERHQGPADEQEHAHVESHGADQLERPDLHHVRAGRGPVRERRVTGRDRKETDREREQHPARRDDGRVAQDGKAALGALGPERDVPQRDRQRDDHAGREPVADVAVALDDDRGGDHDRGAQEPRATTSMTVLTSSSHGGAGSRRR